MKKEIKKTNNNIYPTIKKLSLSMTIIGWVLFGLTIILSIVGATINGESEEIKQLSEMLDNVTSSCGGLLFLSVFLGIGQIILAKKVQNVTPKITQKQSIIMNAVAIGAVSLGLIVAAAGYLLGINGVLKNDSFVFVLAGGVVLAILASLFETIVATIILAQIKVKKGPINVKAAKKPAKKGKK